MNPYPDRIAELHSHLAAVWSQRDTVATEILLAALLPASLTRIRRPWLIVETDYLHRDTSAAWFSFGLPDTTHVRSLALARVQRRDPGTQMIEGWLQERTRDVPGLWVDAEWRRLAFGGSSWVRERHSVYAVLMAMCVRLRVEYPKGDTGIRQDRDADLQELARLTRRVLDSQYRSSRAHGTPQGVPLAPQAAQAAQAANTQPAQPGSLFYWCELLQRVAPSQSDWDTLTGSLAAIARGISLLYMDGRAPDWAAAERVLRDCVPYATGWLISEAHKSPSAAHATYKKTGGDFASEERVAVELRRLHKEGVLLRRQARKVVASSLPWRYRVAHADWVTLLDRDTRILI